MSVYAMLKRLRVRLTEGGAGSEIVDVDSGRAIDGVRTIRIEASVGKATTVHVELIGVEVEGDITTLANTYITHRGSLPAPNPNE